MIRIAISAEAFEAIARTLPLGSVSFENKTDEEGQRPDLVGQGCRQSAALVAGRGRELQRRDPADRGPEIGGDYDGVPKLQSERGYAGDASQRRRGGGLWLIRHPVAGATAQKLIAAKTVKQKTDADAGDK